MTIYFIASPKTVKTI